MYKFYYIAGHASVPLMSVDLVTIAISHAPDLHPPGASKTYHANNKPDDTGQKHLCSEVIHIITKQNGIHFFEFLLHYISSCTPHKYILHTLQ
jgi:hypothetical protein